MKKFLKRLILLLVCLAIAFVLVRFGPNLYYRFFGEGNTVWISERFSEELKEQNELIVFESTITGQETVSQNAWLLGTVQKVQVPYSYSVSFSIDLSQSKVSLNDRVIQIALPLPKAGYSKLTVDEENMKKNDWLYPLTPERYAIIKKDVEARLFTEASENQDYLDAAWDTAVKNMTSLFQTIAESSALGATCTVEVVQLQVVPPVVIEVP